MGQAVGMRGRAGSGQEEGLEAKQGGSEDQKGGG